MKLSLKVLRQKIHELPTEEIGTTMKAGHIFPMKWIKKDDVLVLLDSQEKELRERKNILELQSPEYSDASEERLIAEILGEEAGLLK